MLSKHLRFCLFFIFFLLVLACSKTSNGAYQHIELYFEIVDEFNNNLLDPSRHDNWFENGISIDYQGRSYFVNGDTKIQDSSIGGFEIRDCRSNEEIGAWVLYFEKNDVKDSFDEDITLHLPDGNFTRRKITVKYAKGNKSVSVFSNGYELLSQSSKYFFFRIVDVLQI